MSFEHHYVGEHINWDDAWARCWLRANWCKLNLTAKPRGESYLNIDRFKIFDLELREKSSVEEFFVQIRDAFPRH